MKPIWYFVGLILLAIGAIILLSGIYLVINPPEIKTVLYDTHPNIWWGIIMLIFGAILYVKNRKIIVA
jgi:hypothetical protein